MFGDLLDTLLDSIREIIDIIINGPVGSAIDLSEVISIFSQFFSKLVDRFEKIANVFSYFLDDDAKSVFMAVIYIWTILMIARLLKSLAHLVTGGVA